MPTWLSDNSLDKFIIIETSEVSIQSQPTPYSDSNSQVIFFSVNPYKQLLHGHYECNSRNKVIINAKCCKPIKPFEIKLYKNCQKVRTNTQWAVAQCSFALLLNIICWKKSEAIHRCQKDVRDFTFFFFIQADKSLKPKLL